MPTRRILLSLVAAAAVSACAPLPARATGSLVDMQIVDRSRGDLLSTWRHRGASWVAGRPGDRYALRLNNRTGGRVLVVLSVDGINVVSGETAATGQTGYVLGPWATAEITGWRKSQSEAAAFYFTALPDSYAARTDRPDNVGVIGAAIFRERVIQPVQRPHESQPPISSGRNDGAPRQEPERRAQGAGAAADADASSERSAAGPAPASPSMRDRESSLAKAEKLGTGHGEREYSPITRTTFERASSQPSEIVQVRYDSYANLLASGVIQRPQPAPQPFYAQPFPGYVPDPR
ncbi:MAG: hypothetical protein ABIQ06_12740 [Caldimonas sp.]